MSTLAARLLLESELRASGLVNAGAPIAEVADLVLKLLEQGLLGGRQDQAAFRAIRSYAQSGEVAHGYCQPNYNGVAGPRRFLLRFADADVSDRHFDDETAARAAFEAATLNWNCDLFGLLER